MILIVFEITKEFSKEYKYTLGQDMKRDALKLMLGFISLKRAYRYLSLENYLHPKEHWQANRNRLLEEAGLLDFADIDQLMEVLQKNLHVAYYKTNRRIKADKNPHNTRDYCDNHGYNKIR